MAAVPDDLTRSRARRSVDGRRGRRRADRVADLSAQADGRGKRADTDVPIPRTVATGLYELGKQHIGATPPPARWSERPHLRATFRVDPGGHDHVHRLVAVRADPGRSGRAGVDRGRRRGRVQLGGRRTGTPSARWARATTGRPILMVRRHADEREGDARRHDEADRLQLRDVDGAPRRRSAPASRSTLRLRTSQTPGQRWAGRRTRLRTPADDGARQPDPRRHPRHRRARHPRPVGHRRARPDGVPEQPHPGVRRGRHRPELAGPAAPTPSGTSSATETDAAAFLVHLGRAFVTSVTLRVVPNYYLQLTWQFPKAADLFAPPSAGPPGRAILLRPARCMRPRRGAVVPVRASDLRAVQQAAEPPRSSRRSRARTTTRG